MPLPHLAPGDKIGLEVITWTKAEYLDPVCCFDASQYIGHPDSEPCASAVIVPEVVKELDRLQNSGQRAGAEAH